MQSALSGMPSGIGAGAGSDLGTGNNIAAAYSAQLGHGTRQADPLALAPSALVYSICILASFLVHMSSSRLERGVSPSASAYDSAHLNYEF